MTLSVHAKLHSQGIRAALSHNAKHQALNEVISVRAAIVGQHVMYAAHIVSAAGVL